MIKSYLLSTLDPGKIVKMKLTVFFFLSGSSLLSFVPGVLQATSFSQSGTENRAIKIIVGSTSGRVDNTTLQQVRDAVGNAIASDTIDQFNVYERNRPASTQYGLSACAEASVNSTTGEFYNFVRQLRSIRPTAGTFLNVELTEDCEEIAPVEPLACGGVLGTPCPDGHYCHITPGQCKANDVQGTCKIIPNTCIDEHRPVCGCDGETYRNACEAARAGVSLDHEGKCKTHDELAS